MPEQNVAFTEECPVCKGSMAKGNFYCSIRCWKEGNKEEEK